MQAKRIGSQIIIRLDKGEELVETLKSYAEQEGIALAHFTGIGATGEVTLGLFETATKTYHSQDLVGDFEIAPVVGNITTMNGETYLHAHITLGDAQLNAKVGHLTKAVISATCEIFITVLDGTVDRQLSDEIGLNLLDLT